MTDIGLVFIAVGLAVGLARFGGCVERGLKHIAYAYARNVVDATCVELRRLVKHELDMRLGVQGEERRHDA
jgi:hypothetical protein